MPTTRPLTPEDLVAIEQIKHLKYRYWRACDAKDPDGFRACFIRHGAKVDYGPLGSFDDVGPMLDIYKQIALERHGDGYAVLDMHHGYMPEIALISDTEAVGTWSLQFRCIDVARRTDRTTIGVYRDRYVIEDGEWKMSETKFTALWTASRPLDESAEVAQFLA